MSSSRILTDILIDRNGISLNPVASQSPVGPLVGLRPFGRGRHFVTVWRASHAASNGSYRIGSPIYILYTVLVNSPNVNSSVISKGEVDALGPAVSPR